MKAKIILSSCMSLMMLIAISCNKNKETVNDNPNPTTNNVYLANENYRWEDTIDSLDYFIDTISYIWEDNLLKQRIFKQSSGGVTVTSTETFDYENELCKEVWCMDHYYFSYEEGRLSESVYVSYYYPEDTCYYYFNYDLNGCIDKMTINAPWWNGEVYFTWLNGDIVSVVSDGVTYTFEYDDKPNMYKGVPLYNLDYYSMACLLSKHNMIDTNEYEYTYIGDRLVAKVCKTDGGEFHYIYTDGTGR